MLIHWGAQELTRPDCIGWGWMIVRQRMEADWTGLWDYALPHVHTTEETEAHIETRLGFHLEYHRHHQATHAHAASNEASVLNPDSPQDTKVS